MERALLAQRIADAEQAAVTSATTTAAEAAAEALHGTLAELEVTTDRLEAANAALGSANAGQEKTLVEQQRAERALRASEARWRGVFEHMHEGFALCEMVGSEEVLSDFRYLEVNDAWERLTGIPAMATVGRTAREIFPGIEDFWAATYRRVVETGEPAHVEHRLGNRWYEVLAYRTEPGRFATLFMNVTERKAAQARQDAFVELGEQARRRCDPMEITSIAVEIIARGLGATVAGYGRRDADQENLKVQHEWTAVSAPLGADNWPLVQFWNDFGDQLARGDVVTNDDVAQDQRTADGADIYISRNVRAFLNIPIVEAGKIIAIFYVHDAVPRRWSPDEVAFARSAVDRAWSAGARVRAEEDLRAANEALLAEETRLRLALEGGRLGTWELDVLTDTALRSERHDAIFGYTTPPPQWGYHRFVSQHLLPEDREHVEDSFRRAVDEGTAWQFECRIRRADTNEVRWIEARGQPMRDAEGQTARLLGVVSDVTERKRAEERRVVLVNELNHRVKNTLAVVQSIAAQTTRSATDLHSFSAAFQERLFALASAHDLLTRVHWEGAALGAVVRAALDPLALGDARVDLSDCAASIVLPPTEALALTMAVHELATNALKHGALSVPEGRVVITCRAVGPDAVAPIVEWVESGGPVLSGPPLRTGFGLRLLGRGLKAEAGMAAALQFEPEGLRCTLRLPRIHQAAPTSEA
ncbi:HWE histidine kinase domain-containing protein [Falsiroseomonas sp. HC035]|uniref:PAS domain-containing sensor histidine kinase n=1 Tax=Falsiroseomonas sp. HC035 TaxID=3390999 RepID=UPI003D30F445